MPALSRFKSDHSRPLVIHWRAAPIKREALLGRMTPHSQAVKRGIRPTNGTAIALCGGGCPRGPPPKFYPATSAILHVKRICVALPRPGMSHYRSHTAPTLTSSALPSAVNAILPRTAIVVAAFGVLSRHSYQWAMTSTGTRASTTAFKHSVMHTASRCFSLVATPYAGSLPCRPTSE